MRLLEDQISVLSIFDKLHCIKYFKHKNKTNNAISFEQNDIHVNYTLLKYFNIVIKYSF